MKRYGWIRSWQVVFMLFVALASASCAYSGSNSSAGNLLYDRIGGLDNLKKISSDFFELLSEDSATNRTFEGVKLDEVEASFASQLCELAGGPCQYKGESMKDAHAGMDITEAEFSRTVAHLRTALDRHTGTREKNELLRLLAGMKRDIVTGPFDGQWEALGDAGNPAQPTQNPKLPLRR